MGLRKYLGPYAFVGALVAATAVQAAPAEQCQTVTPELVNGYKVFQISEIWSGVRTGLGAAEPENGKLLVAYYGKDRHVTLTRADASTGEVCSIQMDSVFKGWDGHNLLALAVSDGKTFIAGNAHASPMFYAEGTTYDLKSYRSGPITAQDEPRMTYPTFIRMPDGTLRFLYRAGTSGNGTWMVDEHDGNAWKRIGPQFAATDQSGGHVSAYPTAILTDSDGVSHVAIVWRRTPDVSSNYAVSYATTTDFHTWKSLSGVSAAVPFRPDASNIIEETGPDKGLLNNAKMVLDADNQPIIFYTRYGKAGTNALIAARPGTKGWTLNEIAVSQNKTPIEGGGSLPVNPSFGITPLGHNLAQVAVAFPGQDLQKFTLDLKTLQKTDAPPAPTEQKPAPRYPTVVTIPQGLSNASVARMTVLAQGIDGPAESQLQWFTQRVNRDKPLPCTTQAPRACEPPPSPLMWLVPAQ